MLVDVGGGLQIWTGDAQIAVAGVLKPPPCARKCRGGLYESCEKGARREGGDGEMCCCVGVGGGGGGEGGCDREDA